MTTHLNDHEIAAAAAGLELDPDAAAHLAGCDSCGQSAGELQRLIDHRRRELNGEAPDWAAQRQQILQRLAAPAPASSKAPVRLRPILAAAAAVLVAFGLSLVPWPVAEDRAGAHGLDVESILAEVEAVLDDDSLPGFEAIDPGLERPQDLFVNGAS